MIEELIKFLGGSALFLGAVAWLIRSLIIHRLNKDITDFKTNLQHESKIEFQKVSHYLRLSGLEYEHRVALLHEKRAEVIAELYRLLIEFIVAAESYTSIAEFSNEPGKNEKETLLNNSVYEFGRYYIINRIYFSKLICNSVDELLTKALGPIQKYSYWRKQEGKGYVGALKANDSWGEASKIITREIPPLLDKIGNEFRNLLGVDTNEIQQQNQH